MNKTVGIKDAKVRTVIGALTGTVSIISLISGSLPVVLSPLLGLISVIMLVTAYTGLCPAYSLIGFSTSS